VRLPFRYRLPALPNVKLSYNRAVLLRLLRGVAGAPASCRGHIRPLSQFAPERTIAREDLLAAPDAAKVAFSIVKICAGILLLLDDLTEAVADGARNEFMESLTTVPLLNIDDFGMRKLPMTAAEDLLDRHAPLRTCQHTTDIESSR
jgi:hypothetical protein